MNLFLNSPAFVEFRVSFECFEKNMTFIAYEFRKLETAKHVVREMSKRSRLRKLFNKRPGKRSLTRLKS